MRQTALLAWCALTLLSAGCSMIDPNSRMNVNRGAFNDDYSVVRKEGRSGEQMDHEDTDGMDKWLYSPKARAINRNLGVD